jgi:hypothetical protein
LLILLGLAFYAAGSKTRAQAVDVKIADPALAEAKTRFAR